MTVTNILMSDVAGNNTVYTAKFAVLQRTPDFIKVSAIDTPTNTVTVTYYSDATGTTQINSVPFVDADTLFFQITID